MILFRGQVDENGKLHLLDRSKFLASLLALRNKTVEVEVRKYRRSRTIQQNKFYFGVVLPILADHTGYSADEMHDALKLKFLLDRERNDELPTVKSTTSLTTQEFIEYIEAIRLLAAEMGVYIPEPNEQLQEAVTGLGA